MIEAARQLKSAAYYLLPVLGKFISQYARTNHGFSLPLAGRGSLYAGLSASYIRVRIERAQCDDMRFFIGESHRHPELFAFRIGDAVDRKYHLPLSAVNLVFSAADDRSRVDGPENYLNVRAGHARRVGGDGRRRVVQLDGFSLLFILQGLRSGVRRFIRRDYFENIAPVRQRVGVNGVIVFAQFGFEGIEFAPATRGGAVIYRIFNCVAILILGLPLQRDRSALEDPAGGNLRYRAEDRRIQSGLIGAGVRLGLRQGLQRHAGRQDGD